MGPRRVGQSTERNEMKWNPFTGNCTLGSRNAKLLFYLHIWHATGLICRKLTLCQTRWSDWHFLFLEMINLFIKSSVKKSLEVSFYVFIDFLKIELHFPFVRRRRTCCSKKCWSQCSGTYHDWAVALLWVTSPEQPVCLSTVTHLRNHQKLLGSKSVWKFGSEILPKCVPIPQTCTNPTSEFRLWKPVDTLKCSQAQLDLPDQVLWRETHLLSEAYSLV